MNPSRIFRKMIRSCPGQAAAWPILLAMAITAASQPVIIQPSDPFQRTMGGNAIANLRTLKPSPDGSEIVLVMDYVYDGSSGNNASIIPVIESRNQKGVSRWFGCDPAIIGSGRGPIAVKVRFFNDEPGAPAALTTDRVRVLLIDSSGRSVIGGNVFLKTIRWGNPSAPGATPAVIPLTSTTPPPAAETDSREARLARERELSQQKGREAEAQREAQRLAKAEEQTRRKLDADRAAEEKTQKRAEQEAARQPEEERRKTAAADAQAAKQARKEADDAANATRRLEREAQVKSEAEAKAREKSAKESEAKALAEQKRQADDLAKAEAAAKREAAANERQLARAREQEEAAKRRAEADNQQRDRAEAEAARRERERLEAAEVARKDQLARIESARKEEQAKAEAARQEQQAKAEAIRKEQQAKEQARIETARKHEEAKRLAAEQAEAAAAKQATAEREKAATPVAPAASAPAAPAAAPKPAVPAPAPVRPAAPIQVASVPAQQPAVPSAPVSANSRLKSKVTNIDIVNRSLDRSEMTIGVEMEYNDNLGPATAMGLDVANSQIPRSASFFESKTVSVGRSRRNFALVPVRFQPPNDLPNRGSTFSTDQVKVYLRESNENQAQDLATAALLLSWRAPGAAAAAEAGAANKLELDDFTQSDLHSGYFTVRYQLENGPGKIRVKISDPKSPESSRWFNAPDRPARPGRGMQLLMVEVNDRAPAKNTTFIADSLEVELLDAAGQTVAKLNRAYRTTWAKRDE